MINLLKNSFIVPGFNYPGKVDFFTSKSSSRSKKLCTIVTENSVFLFTESSVLLFTDYTPQESVLIRTIEPHGKV
jgi:hypothetical protein